MFALNTLSKCDLMHFWSNTMAAGFFPSQNAVANAMANTPQSLDPLCHWTSWYTILMHLDLFWNKLAIIFFVTGDSVMCRLSYIFTVVSDWFWDDDIVIQWLLFMFKIWTSSPCWGLNAIFVANIGDCNEPIFGCCLLRMFWKAAIMASSSQALEFGSSIFLWIS